MAKSKSGGTKSKSAKSKSAKSKKGKSDSDGSGRRKITDEIVERAIEMRDDGETWAEIEEETGFNGAQLRPHMAKVQGVDLQVAKTPKAIAKARKQGHAWYAIAAATGLSVAEVKEKAEEGGADVVGRVAKEGSDNGGSKGKSGKKSKAGKRRKAQDPSK